MKLPYTLEAIKGMDEGVFIVNRDRQITLWNTAAERLTGFSENDMFGKSCSKHVRCHLDYNGQPICDTACPLKLALQTGKPQQMITQMKNRTGQVLTVRVQVMPYCNESGFVAGAIEQFQVIEPAQHHSDLRSAAPYFEKKKHAVSVSA